MVPGQPAPACDGVEPAPSAVHVLAVAGRDGRWEPVALELLGDASVLAQRWHGLVAAWVLGEHQPSEAALEELAVHGADVVCVFEHPHPAAWSSEVVAAALADHVAPPARAILLAGGSRGEEVAALLAARLETEWVADALTLAVTRGNALEIAATLPGGRLARLYRPDAGKPVVVSMRPGVAEVRKRDRPAKFDVRRVPFDPRRIEPLTEVEAFLPADHRSVDLVFAERIISAGRGAGGPAGVELIARLADALGAALGASRMVVDLGWAPHERQIGLTGRTVRPELYVACGISGASHHVAGMRDARHILAINPDRTAPIHEVAHLCLHGDLHQVVPAILAALAKRGVAAAERVADTVPQHRGA